MYTQFLKVLAEISEHLDAACRLGGELGNLPEPYICGAIEVRLEGDRVGEFRLDDEWATYYPDPPRSS